VFEGWSWARVVRNTEYFSILGSCGLTGLLSVDSVCLNSGVVYQRALLLEHLYRQRRLLRRIGADLSWYDASKVAILLQPNNHTLFGVQGLCFNRGVETWNDYQMACPITGTGTRCDEIFPVYFFFEWQGIHTNHNKYKNRFVEQIKQQDMITLDPLSRHQFKKKDMSFCVKPVGDVLLQRSLNHFISRRSHYFGFELVASDVIRLKHL
jgi:hypothetical protein